MRISEFIATIKKDNPPLYWTGVINFLLFAVCFILFFFDSRLVMGINTWIKPMKFGLSVGIYCWTFAWLLRYLADQRIARLISWVVVSCMIVENVIITLQAARGVTSHYNISTGLNASLFSIMGVFIGINTIAILYTWLVFLFTPTTLDKNMLLAWRLGLLLFLVGGAAGGMMIGSLAHTVGAIDGGAGIPFLNWSSVAGDLRSAHFITMHGLQVIPLFGFYIARRTKNPRATTYIFFGGYFLVCFLLHWVALHGLPFYKLAEN
jgi:hypothetical protein